MGFGLFCCCFLPLNEQDTPPALCQTAPCPIVAINSSNTSTDLDARFQSRPGSIHVRCMGPSHIPQLSVGVEVPTWSQVLLWQRWNASSGACLVSVSCMRTPLGRAQKGIFPVWEPCLLRRTLLYTKGQPWCFCHFFSSKCLSSITGMPFKSIANTLTLYFNQILAMFSIYKLTLIHTNPFSASRTAILSPFFKPVTILPFMSKPSSTINCFT